MPAEKVSREARHWLHRLNSWDSGELDVYERPEAHANRDPSGETVAWVQQHKGALKDLGVEVGWDAAARIYRIAAADKWGNKT